MTTIAGYLGQTDFLDKNFIGTIAFRSEELALPDGSKMALGIDGGHWVLVYQPGGGTPFQVFEYDREAGKIIVDKKPGAAGEIREFKRLVGYLFARADVEDLVTLLPPQVTEKE
ncbi:MAG: hypothetical protein JW873_00340 [Candidatus Saganbacteria bacterium]|nr:hypothetical protein [Candidatus Saganbacteria bacterium]